MVTDLGGSDTIPGTIEPAVSNTVSIATIANEGSYEPAATLEINTNIDGTETTEEEGEEETGPANTI